MNNMMTSRPTQASVLEFSQDMIPVHGYIDVKIPIEVMWEHFMHPNRWNRWNDCFFWALNSKLQLGEQLIWCFQPIRSWFLYKMPAIAKIIELQHEEKVTWEVTILPGFYARHTYYMEDLGDGTTRFGSWEKATGWSFRLLKWFWIPHFIFVKNRSLAGAKVLEEVYSQKGVLHEESLPRKNYWRLFLSLILVLFLLIGGSLGTWFYSSYIHQTAIKLAPGIDAVIGGGGNSLVIAADKEVTIIDPKFSPGAESLRKWVKKKYPHKSVTQIINTHYHYDHTQGNILYPNAHIYAHRNVPDLMRERDGEWWEKHESGIPQGNYLVNRRDTLTVEDKKVENKKTENKKIENKKIENTQLILTYPGIAHTHGDLWIYLPKENIIATGDLLFNQYYPFFDLGKGGISIPNSISAIRKIAQNYPTATYLPGHGAIATSQDFLKFADYLDFLYNNVGKAYKNGLSEDEAVKSIDLSEWNLQILPSFHNGKLTWAKAENNIRWVYRMFSSI
ncbi:MAG: MBL fold metallo-hydrolase [Cyanobacteria bacterium P01_A01_bin.45]